MSCTTRGCCALATARLYSIRCATSTTDARATEEDAGPPAAEKAVWRGQEAEGVLPSYMRWHGKPDCSAAQEAEVFKTQGDVMDVANLVLQAQPPPGVAIMYRVQFLAVYC
jgi:hypothetical protein